MYLDNDVDSMNDARQPAQNCQQDIDENICTEPYIYQLYGLMIPYEES